MRSLGDMRAAAAAAVAATGILAAREELHGWVARITWPELRSALVLLAMTFIVLPVCRTLRSVPFGGVNPREVWLIAIVLAGVSFLGYGAVKLFGAERGVLLAGAGRRPGVVDRGDADQRAARRRRRRRAAPAGGRRGGGHRRSRSCASSPSSPSCNPACCTLIGAAVLAAATLVAVALCGASRSIGARPRTPATSRTPARLRNPFSFWPVVGFAVFLGVVIVLGRVIGETLRRQRRAARRGRGRACRCRRRDDFAWRGWCRRRSSALGASLAILAAVASNTLSKLVIARRDRPRPFRAPRWRR